MTALLLPVFAASLLGSLHCAGMCGGLVCFFSNPSQRQRQWTSHTAYHGGRLVSYLLLGGAAGALGSGLDRLGVLGGVGRLAGTAAGVLMIGWGLAQLWTTGRRRALTPDSAAGRWITPILTRLGSKPPVVRAGLLGLLTTMIPCGWLYGYGAVAAGTGSVSGGAMVMAAFWLGTVPALAAVGIVTSRLAGVTRQRVPLVTASVLIVLGLFTLTGRLRPGSSHSPTEAAAPTAVMGSHGDH